MKVAFLCCVLLLAGSASCSPVEAQSISLPDWFPDIVIPDNIVEWIAEQIANLPDSIQNIIDRLPEIIDAIPDIMDNVQEIVGEIIDKIPEIIPIILDKLPEIIAQVPAIVDKIRDIVEQIIEKIPELIPVILEKIPEIVAAIPGILEKIRDILEGLDLPDWFPTLPDLEKPEWWPIELPTLPEYNEAVPGTSVSVSDYPAVVQIEIGTGPVWVQGCAGSVLTNQHVLSAARCFSGRNYSPRFRRVLAGSSTRFTDGSIVPVQSSVNHPSFISPTSEGDIAVVRLAHLLVFNPTIQQAPIVPQGFNLPVGISVKLAGWGSTAEGKLISDRNLYEIDLATVSPADCSERWNRVPLLQPGADKLCVARPETGGRNGDVRDIGAPVFYDNILVGVVSYGAPIGNQYFPVVTTSVSSYTTWIVSNAY